ncbi:hypothetical protein EST38_g5376 [Candolleomyces aberdarensis]|uniref:Uncharacterized protein n=1 Tax=Candolleomyces aberdarensis TaxID=2316362 RepID=A0A4Q2DMB3_9AGAR|nr:hypothetical protein EST38_g5376 [Candolleomyces aberdarensis]
MASTSQSTYLSTELAVTLAVVAAGIGYGFYTRTQAHNATASANSGPAGSAPVGSGTTGKGKGKKKAKASTSLSSSATAAKAAVDEPATPLVVPFPDVIVGGGSGVIPGGFEFKDGDDEESAAGASASALSKSKKSKKNKKKAPATAEGSAAGVAAAGKQREASPSPTGASTPRPAAAVDSDADSASGPQPQPSKKSKKKKSKAGGAEAALAASVQQRSHQHPLEHSTASIDTDGSWTRVESRHRSGNNNTNLTSSKNDDSGAGLTPTTGNSSPVLERSSVTSSAEDDGEEGSLGNLNHRDSSDKKKTFAEKMIPKPRKTGVEDLLETPDYPTLSRVMRIKPGPDDKPATGFSWADYEDVDTSRVTNDEDDADGSEDDGWGVVKSKRSRQAERSPNFATTSTATSVQSSSRVQEQPAALTKQQRKNAKRKEAEKATKVAVREDQEAAFRKHKRELEKARMVEQASSRKATSGGMKAVVDGNGKLVWE